MTIKKAKKSIGQNTLPIQESLKKLGLSETQSLIYSVLSENGSNRAQRVAFYSGLTRPLTYKILKQLIDLGLVEERINSGAKTTIYSVLEPHTLEKFVTDKQQTYQEAKYTYDNSISYLVSKYNLTNKKPNVSFFEGISGLKKLYEEILLDGHDMLLLRSFLDQSVPELKELVDKQIISQIRRNIHTRAITPLREPLLIPLTENDKKG